jgi:hypothetical protein
MLIRSQNANAALVFEFLRKFVAVIQAYFGVVRCVQEGLPKSVKQSRCDCGGGVRVSCVSVARTHGASSLRSLSRATLRSSTSCSMVRWICLFARARVCVCVCVGVCVCVCVCVCVGVCDPERRG